MNFVYFFVLLATRIKNILQANVLGKTPSSGAYCVVMSFPPVSEFSSTIN
jgi:hypothetical protein